MRIRMPHPETWLRLEVVSAEVTVEQVGMIDAFRHATRPVPKGGGVTFGNLGRRCQPPGDWGKGWFLVDGRSFELVQNGHLFPDLREARWPDV